MRLLANLTLLAIGLLCPSAWAQSSCGACASTSPEWQLVQCPCNFTAVSECLGIQGTVARGQTFYFSTFLGHGANQYVLSIGDTYLPSNPIALPPSLFACPNLYVVPWLHAFLAPQVGYPLLYQVNVPNNPALANQRMYAQGFCLCGAPIAPFTNMTVISFTIR